MRTPDYIGWLTHNIKIRHTYYIVIHVIHRASIFHSGMQPCDACESVASTRQLLSTKTQILWKCRPQCLKCDNSQPDGGRSVSSLVLVHLFYKYFFPLCHSSVHAYIVTRREFQLAMYIGRHVEWFPFTALRELKRGMPDRYFVAFKEYISLETSFFTQGKSCRSTAATKGIFRGDRFCTRIFVMKPFISM